MWSKAQLETAAAGLLAPRPSLVGCTDSAMIPTLSLPPEDTSGVDGMGDSPLPELPKELLLSLHQALDRDALDEFVLGGDGLGGGAQVEDVLNDLIPDG